MGLFSRKHDKKDKKEKKKNKPASKPPKWLPKFMRGGRVAPHADVEEERNLSASFQEHYWDLKALSQHNPHSRLNIVNPKLSLGLTHKEAAEYLINYGPNALPKPKEVKDIVLFLQQFLNLLWILLIVTDILAIIGFILQPEDWRQCIVAVVIFVMIFGMCFASFLHEREAHRVVRGFQNLLPDTSIVIRDGKEESISAEELVIGDVIWIKSGTRVPADARIIYCRQLKLETSSITGEAEPNEYQWEAVEPGVTIFDSHNVAFNGSLCVDGEGIAVVIRTGTDTVIGHIASLTTSQKTNRSQLQLQIRRFVIFLTFTATTISICVFTAGGFVHRWKDTANLLCLGFIACAIGTVPTGMPATVTSIIALVARRLAKKNVFLKRLDIVEALGSVTIIASDKTGTLTKNIMTVTDVWFYDEFVNGVPKRTVKDGKNKSGLDRFEGPLVDLLDVMSVCNASNFVKPSASGDKSQLALEMPDFDDEEGKIKAASTKPAQGVPSEIAMLRYADQVINIDAARAEYDIVYEVPFNSKRKWHMMIARIGPHEDGQAEYKILIKGASEILIKLCSQIQTKNGTQDLNAEVLDKFQAAYETFGASGRRVIGFCTKHFVDVDHKQWDFDEGNVPLTELTFVGISAIMDPPRDETAGAVEECRTAGIKVFMVTGDHHLTAAAIAREIKLIKDVPGEPKNYEVIHGEAINVLTEHQWDELLNKQALVFARTTPEQKLLIVEQCQKRKYNIAMTGDGVNDSPALKKADIGIAMGSGSDVAKQASDIILMDDNFSSIVRGVKEGRMMFDNIKKLLAYLTLHATPEIWPIVINFAFGMPLGLTALQIITIDLGTELAPGISMSQEPAEGDIMLRPPRRRGKTLVSNTLMFYSYVYGGAIQAVGCFLSYCTVFWLHGISIGDLWMAAIDHFQPGAPEFCSNGHCFNAEQQVYMNRQACGAWQVGIVFSQFFHILCIRTRRQSIFTHGLFVNWRSWVSMALEIILVCIMVYVPGLNYILGGAPVPLLCWGVILGAGIFMFIFQETRKFCIRNWADEHPLVHCFKW